MQRAPKKQRTIKATVHTAHGDQAKIGLRAQTLWSTNDGLPSLRSLTRCSKHDLNNIQRCVVSIPTEVAANNLCMRMQTTAHTLLCTAKHDCTMNALRTGHSQHERQGSRPNRHPADNRAGPVQSMPSLTPYVSQLLSRPDTNTTRKLASILPPRWAVRPEQKSD